MRVIETYVCEKDYAAARPAPLYREQQDSNEAHNE